MASSSVQYYEKQKELQDTITNCEQKRMDLERELRMSLQSGQTSSKMKAARLHSYWKKICEDEKKAKQRNEALMREFERIDSHMNEMSARTQRLALMKKQYEDYISRTYPKWNELMYGNPQSSFVPTTQSDPTHETATKKSSLPHVSRQQSDEREHIESQDISPKQAVPVPSASVTTSSHTNQVFASPQVLSSTQHNPGNVRQSSSIFDHNSSPLPEQIYQNIPSPHSENVPVSNSNTQVSSSGHIEASSQPVQSIAIQSKTSRQTIQSSNYSMQPAVEDEDDISNFGTDTDIPLNTSDQNMHTLEDKEENLERKSHGLIRPELSIDGLLYLLRLVEEDINDAFSLEGYYRSSWPETIDKNDIIRKANANEDLSRIDVNLISMVILEQITLIIRSLSEKCLIPESVLQGDISTLSPHKLSQLLSPEAQIVWSALFAHFVKLVDSQVMKSYELSAIFTPCMVLENTSQDKAHSFVVQLLETLDNPGPHTMHSTGKSLSPANTLEGSGSFVEDGKVPRLKFGSLLERPLSDDDSSFINSLPRDTVPLNETAAYRSMLSTGGSEKPRRQSSTQEDRQSSTQEDTDDDVEKQIASALNKPTQNVQTPRKIVDDEPSETTSQTMSHVYVPTALSAKSPRQPAISPQKKIQGVRISSDLDTDTEVDAGVFGSSKQPDDDFDFYD